MKIRSTSLGARLLAAPSLSPALAVGGLLTGFLFWAAWPNEVVRHVMTEGGPVESLTVIAYLLAVLSVWAYSDSRLAPSVWVSQAVVMLAFAMRELDWHKAFTGKSVLKLSYYLEPGPLLPKLVALCAVAATAIAVLHLLRVGTRLFWRALRRGDAAAVTLATFLVVLVLSKIGDRSLNIVRDDFGLPPPEWAYALQAALEEGIELLLPLLVPIALAQRCQAYEAQDAVLQEEPAKTVRTPV